MNDSDKLGFTEEGSIEIEFSEQDLLELSFPATERREHRAEPPALEPRAAEVVAAIAQPVQTPHAPASSNYRIAASRIALALTIAATAVTVVAATYQHQQPTPEHAVPPSVNSLPQETVPVETSPSTTDIKQPPVLFKNPFDHSEVFEFPAGTSKAEARAAVADLLMKRAMERQQQIDARVSQRHSQ